jgi:hypothetical protein
MSWSWPTFWYVLIIGILILAFILVLFWFFSLMRKRRAGPTHIELYFDDNFRKIVDEWDLISRDRVKEWKKDIKSRLTVIGTDLTTLENNRDTLEKRMTKLDREISKLEGF